MIRALSTPLGVEMGVQRSGYAKGVQRSGNGGAEEWIVYTVQYILYSIYCTVYIVQYILYNIYCTVYTVQYILYSIYYPLLCTPISTPLHPFGVSTPLHPHFHSQGSGKGPDHLIPLP